MRAVERGDRVLERLKIWCFGEASAKEQVQENPVTEPNDAKTKKTVSFFLCFRMATVFMKML